MNREDGLAARRPSVALLEERVHRLESRVTTLADALRLLARGLEDGPMSEPGDRRPAEGPGRLMTCCSPLRHRPGPRRRRAEATSLPTLRPDNPTCPTPGSRLPPTGGPA